MPSRPTPPTLLLLAHFVVGWPIFFAVTLLTFGVGGLAQLLVLPLDPARRVAACTLHHGWGRWLWWTAPFWGCQRRGLDHVGAGPYLLVANHESVLDIPAVLGLPLSMRIAGRRELFDLPVLGHLMRLTRQVRVDEGSPEGAQAFLASCEAVLAAGQSVLIFPEGTRSTDGELRSFHRGAFRAAMDFGVPILPIAVVGTSGILPKGRFWPRVFTTSVELSVLHPVSPQSFATARALSNHVHRLLGEELRVIYGRRFA